MRFSSRRMHRASSARARPMPNSVEPLPSMMSIPAWWVWDRMSSLDSPSSLKGTPPTVTAEKGTMEESPCSPRQKAETLRRSTPAPWLTHRTSRAVSSKVPVLKHCHRSSSSARRSQSATISAGLVMVTTGQVSLSGFNSFARVFSSSTDRPSRSSRVWPGSRGSPMAITTRAASLHSPYPPARTVTAWSMKLALSATSRAWAAAFSGKRSTRTISSQSPAEASA